MKKVYLVTGAPGSGKTTYVKQVASKKDLVFDLDSINTALGGEMHGNNLNVLPVALSMRQAAIEAITNGSGEWENAYFISAASDRKAIDSLCKQLNATEIQMDATPEQCRERIYKDTTRINKAEHINLVDRWFANNGNSTGQKVESKPKTPQEEFAEWAHNIWG